MKIVFAGTPVFARTALERLHGAGIEIALVLTQPDRPAGRGMKLQASPVKQFALAHGIAVAQPRSLRLDGKYPDDATAARQALAAAQADAMVVVAYGLLLPQWVLDAPCLGCFNIHASWLPRWRGAAPIHRAIEAGDTQTGVTIMQMDAGLDTGDMLLSETMPILSTDTTATLHDRLAEQGGRLIVQALVQMQGADLHRVPQPVEGVTYAHKIDKAESSVDWTQPAEAIGRHIRALTPFPGASTTLDGELIKLVDYEIDSCQRLTDKRCGQILSVNSQGITVACGEGALRLTVLQRAGGKRLAAADFVRGFPLLPGMVLGPSAQTGSGG